MDYVKAPYRVATSPTAKRTYIRTVLFVSASVVLLGIAALAYPVFYYNYVPKKLITVPIHLQYNAGLNPYGILTLSPDLMQEQAYDVTVDLTLPRSPTNLERGNFMVALYALKSAPINPALLSLSSSSNPGPGPGPGDPYQHVVTTADNVVFASRRPVLIPYADPLVTTASRVLFLLYHLMWPHAAETMTLTVPMGELVEFPPRGKLPLSLLVDVQTGTGGQTPPLQVYSSQVTLVARLSGMRWFMYNHRILAFAVCTTAFWIAEMVAMGVAWGMLRLWFPSGQEKEVKTEEIEGPRGGGMYERMRRGNTNGKNNDDDDDDSLKLKAEKNDDDDDVKIKDESPDPESEPEMVSSRRYRHAGGDADDEGGSEEDAGVGTSFHEGTEGGQVRRRMSRGGNA
ncbi:putative adipose-regulatory protein-domain-containing protein [Xylaria cubensis]|nr:putative adipose-regulatory protein-domain-containing protein [Xylaria cubensis]